MEITLKLDNFEGPLDLLLHLIDKKELEISKIKISQLIDEYLGLLTEARKDNLNIKVEFLTTASELLEIKALSILNLREKEKREEEFSKRLQEYKLFKEISLKFREMENEYNLSYSLKEGRKISKIPNMNFDLNNISAVDIFKVYSRYLGEGTKETLEINLEQNYNLQEEMKKIIIDNQKIPIKIIEIFNLSENKIHLVYILLAILELYKENLIALEGENLRII